MPFLRNWYSILLKVYLFECDVFELLTSVSFSKMEGFRNDIWSQGNKETFITVFLSIHFDVSHIKSAICVYKYV